MKSESLDTQLTRLDLFEKLQAAKRELVAQKLILDKKDKHKYPIVEVPFNIPKNWKWSFLSDISIIQEGPGIRKHQYQDEGIQFLTVTNILEGSVDLEKSKKYISTDEFKTKYQHYRINKGDIVTACSGASWGKSAIYEDDELLMLNTSTLRLRFFNDLGDNRYLYYLTKTEYFKDNLASHSTGQQPNYGYSHYSKIPVPLPPLPEQQSIVSILDRAFAAIDQAKANYQKCLSLSKELFESYLQGVFENKGEGWEIKQLGEVCNFVRGPFGGSLKKSIFKDSGFAVYEQQHAINNQFSAIRYFIDEQKFKEMKRFELRPNDLIMSCSGTMGKVAIVPEKITQGIINQALLKLTCKPMLNVEYLKLWMDSSQFIEEIEKNTVGAAIKNVASVKVLKTIQIPLPPIFEQQNIVSTLDILKTETQKLETLYQKKIAALDELKKSILQKAFKGELRDAELDEPETEKENLA
jgi:type I restriction enzyme, S subunit